MVLFSEMFASELINDPVVDRLQEPVGRVKDIIITLGEVFPKVSGLLLKIEGGKREEKVLLIGEIDLIGKQFVSTQSTKDRIPFTTLREGDVLLQKDVMDQQIVDLEGARVIRVNDLQLAKVDQDIRLIAADVGFKGMLRRIGIDGFVSWLCGIFRIKTREQLIGWDHVQNLAGGKIAVPSKSITDLHPADVAQIISQVRSEQRTEIFSALNEKTAAESLHELEPMIGAMLLMTVDAKKALSILEKMPVDEAADILGDLPPERAEEFLRLMKIRKSNEIRKLLKHHDETAGGLMTTEFVSIPVNFTAEQTINRMRELAPDAETIYYLYVVDEAERLAGILTLRRLLVSPADTPISEIMVKDIVYVFPEMNQRKAADFMSKYNLLIVPVVDHEKKMLGIITIDDVIDLVLPPVSRRKRQMLG
ncbi:MAG: MgtE integral membrane protein [Candidatus Saganbacteria bacterium]|uniref:MgtE integral membrane protein n=1 Tax=Candidatus Saganbacteria bacterium TaxID=2575572 RepID=A0A833NRL0_UNCSA|nr:MAG: MgtE integral membrane protein [Candidatus Saganbacteria bacterium]